MAMVAGSEARSSCTASLATRCSSTGLRALSPRRLKVRILPTTARARLAAASTFSSCWRGRESRGNPASTSSV